MDLDDIKRVLRAEIKKRENEQYFTFQCNVRQMCKDVLGKLEEQESEIAELKGQYKDMDVTHTVHIAKMNARIDQLEDERRWRTFPYEKPEEDTWCIVFHDGEIDSDHYTRFAYNNKCDFALYGNEVTHWMPLPSAPKESNK